MKFKKWAFSSVPVSSMDWLDPFAQVIYMWLCKYSNDEWICFPSLDTLSKNCWMSKNTVIKYLGVLESLSFIMKNNRFKKLEFTSNEYTVLIKENSGSEDEQPSAFNELGSAPREQPSAPREQELIQLTKSTELNNITTKENILSNDNIKKKKTNPCDIIFASALSSKAKEDLCSFVEHRVQIKKPMTDKAVQMIIKRYDEFSDEEMADAIMKSIISGYQWIFPQHKPQQHTEHKKEVENQKEINIVQDEDYEEVENIYPHKYAFDKQAAFEAYKKLTYKYSKQDIKTECLKVKYLAEADEDVAKYLKKFDNRLINFIPTEINQLAREVNKINEYLKIKYDWDIDKLKDHFRPRVHSYWQSKYFTELCPIMSAQKWPSLHQLIAQGKI